MNRKMKTNRAARKRFKATASGKLVRKEAAHRHYLSNKLNSKKLPIWISDFVLGNYATGAVVGVPGHDKRDFEFAKKFDLEISNVVENPENRMIGLVMRE